MIPTNNSGATITRERMEAACFKYTWRQMETAAVQSVGYDPQERQGLKKKKKVLMKSKIRS